MGSEDRTLDHFYSEAYSAVYGKGAVGFFSSLAHKSLEQPFTDRTFLAEVLEVGAGNSEHLPYVTHRFENYVESDLRLPESSAKSRDSRVTRVVADASDLSSFDDQVFDRLIATCLLSHLPEPEIALAEWKRVVKPGGYLSIHLPTDPGILLRLAQRISTRRLVNRLNHDYDSIHLQEHRFSFPYLVDSVRRIFEGNSMKFRTFPAAFLGWDLSLWANVQIKLTKHDALSGDCF